MTTRITQFFCTAAKRLNSPEMTTNGVQILKVAAPSHAISARNAVQHSWIFQKSELFTQANIESDIPTTLK